MEKSGFFNSVNKDRTYLAEDFAKYFSLVVANGVFPQSADWLKVKPAGGMTVALSLGYAWINGYNYQNDSDKVFTLDVADGSSDRIDSIMVRWSKADRKITSVLVKGNISSDPVAPSVQRDGDYYDLKVANIKVDAGITQIEERHIEDTRFDSSVCGIVAGAVKQIDTTDLFSQYDDTFKEFMKTVEDTLSGDVAGNLLVNIETHKADTEVHLRRLSYAKSGTTHQLTGLTAVSGVVSCVFTATADFAAGDTVTVDGTAYTIQLSSGDAPADKLFVSGASVPIVVDKGNKKVNFKAGGGYVKGDIIAAENLESSLGNFSKLDMIPEYAQQYVSPYTQLEIDNQANFTKQCIVTYNINTGSRLIVFKHGSYVDVLTPLGAKVSRLSGFDADDDIIDASGFGLIMAARGNSTYGYDLIRNRNLHFSAGYSTVLTAKNFIAIIDNSSWATYNAEWCYFSGQSWSGRFGADYDLGDANAIALSKNCVMFYRSLSSGKMYVFNRTSNKRIKNINAADLAINPANLEADSVHAITFPEETKYFVVRKSGIVDLCTFDPEANTVSVIKSDVGYYGISGNAQLIGSKGFLINGYKKDSSGTAYGLIEALADGTLLNFWQYGSGYDSETRQYARPTSSGWHCLFLNGEDLFRFPTIRGGALSIGLCGKESYKVLEVVK